MGSWLQGTAYPKIMVVLFATHLIHADSFANDCSNSHSPIVKCVNKSLTKIPNWMPSNITVLDLSHNPFLKIQGNSLLRFTRLTQLSLKHCNLDRPFRIPTTLKKIDISDNLLSIESIAAIFENKEESHILSINAGGNNLNLDGHLSVFPRLVQFLQLDRSILRKITTDDFKGLPNLIHLDLEHSNIHSIAKGAFDTLRQLKYINLKLNRLRKLPRRIFEQNANLSLLNIEWNFLVEFPDLTGIQQLTHLRLMRNRIRVVNAHNIGCNEILSIGLSSNKIESFNFTGIKYYVLDMANNSITHIRQGSLGKNQLISALILSGNKIAVLQKDCFHGIHSINELYLQGNNLRWIEKDAFRDMSIQKLFLFNNNLTGIPGVLQEMKGNPHLLLLFGNPHITFMQTSDYQNMTPNSQIYLSCRSFQTFSLPFVMKAKLICSPSTTLMIRTATRSLVGNGFICKGHWPFKCYPCAPGEYDAAVDGHTQQNCKPCPYGAFYQDEIAATKCKVCPMGQYVLPHKGPGKSPLDCLTCPKGTDTNTSAG